MIGSFKRVVTVLFLMCFILPFTASCVDQSPIRIATIEDSSYFQIDSAGRKSGYFYEYMQELSKYSGRRFEYVVGKDWVACQQMLADGSVDAISPASKTPERSAQYYFSKAAMGTRYMALAVRDNEIAYRDYAGFDGMRIGIVSGTNHLDILNKLAAEKHFGFTPVFASDFILSRANLAADKVDAILITSLENATGLSIVDRFSPSDFYIMMKDPDVAQDIDAAMEDLQIRNPIFLRNLSQKYYGDNHLAKSHLTREELDFVNQNESVRVAAVDGLRPLSYYENGVYQGIPVEITKEITARFGLKFELIKTDSYQEALDMIREGKADIISAFICDYAWADENDLIFSKPFMQYAYSLLVRKNAPDISRIAVVRGYSVNESYIAQNFSERQIAYFDSEQEAAQAVVDRQCDAACISIYVAERMAYAHPTALESRSMPEYTIGLSFGLSKNFDPRLLSILDKSIDGNLQKKYESLMYDYYFRVSPHDLTLTDYIYEKPEQVLLISFVLFVVILASLISIYIMKRNTSRKLLQYAYTDQVTGLSNLGKFYLDAAQILKNAVADEYTMLAFDVNDFKYINENFGFAVGDAVIECVAEYGKAHIPPKTLFARIDADRFVLLAHTRIGDKSVVELHKSRLSLMQTNLAAILGQSQLVHFCTGVYRIHDPSEDLRVMIDKANIAKKRGKEFYYDTCFEYNSDIAAETALRKEITMNMHRALEKEDFLPYLQPQYSFKTEKVVGAEILVRWDDGHGGLIYPNDFIPIFEDNGFIVKLDFYMFRKTCIVTKQLKELYGKDAPQISVNCSRVTLLVPSLIPQLKRILDEYDLEPNDIEIEITEGALERDPDHMIDLVNDLKEAGFYTSIDDFGSGYSSLGLFHRITIDVLKLNKTFIDEGFSRPNGLFIVKQIIDLANGLNLRTVAEGVETKQQVDKLKEFGCDVAQGFYYARPMPVKQFFELLDK